MANMQNQVNSIANGAKDLGHQAKNAAQDIKSDIKSGAKELKAEAKDKMADAKNAVADGSAEAHSQFSDMYPAIADKFEQVQGEVKRQLAKFTDGGRVYATRAEDTVKRYPLATVVGAVAVGAIIGTLLTRSASRE